MSDIDDMRREAAACRRFGVAKLDWCENPTVIARYAKVPQTIADIQADAEVLLRAGARLEGYVAVMVERERESA